MSPLGESSCRRLPGRTFNGSQRMGKPRNQYSAIIEEGSAAARPSCRGPRPRGGAGELCPRLPLALCCARLGDAREMRHESETLGHCVGRLPVGGARRSGMGLSVPSAIGVGRSNAATDGAADASSATAAANARVSEQLIPGKRPASRSFFAGGDRDRTASRSRCRRSSRNRIVGWPRFDVSGHGLRCRQIADRRGIVPGIYAARAAQWRPSNRRTCPTTPP